MSACRQPRVRVVMDAETAAELYDDGTDAGAAMAAEACGMEFSDFVTRNAPGATSRKRRRKRRKDAS